MTGQERTREQLVQVVYLIIKRHNEEHWRDEPYGGLVLQRWEECPDALCAFAVPIRDGIVDEAIDRHAREQRRPAVTGQERTCFQGLEHEPERVSFGAPFGWRTWCYRCHKALDGRPLPPPDIPSLDMGDDE